MVPHIGHVLMKRRDGHLVILSAAGSLQGYYTGGRRTHRKRPRNLGVFSCDFKTHLRPHFKAVELRKHLGLRCWGKRPPGKKVFCSIKIAKDSLTCPWGVQGQDFSLFFITYTTRTYQVRLPSVPLIYQGSRQGPDGRPLCFSIWRTSLPFDLMGCVIRWSICSKNSSAPQ